GEDQVHTARVNVERLHAEAAADLVERHGRALEMPPRSPAAERRVPRGADLLVGRVRRLPQGEVTRVLFGVLVARDPRADLDLPRIEPRQPAVGGKAIDREVDRMDLAPVSE